MPPPDEIPGEFPVTDWVVIRSLSPNDLDSPDAHQALDRLCRIYWPPLYGFARRYGLSPEDAQDATQGYFIAILERRFFEEADEAKGKLRSFLMASFVHYIQDIFRRESAQKRGGGAHLVSFDGVRAEQWFGEEAADLRSPQMYFEYKLAMRYVELALADLQQAYAAVDQFDEFKLLRPHLEIGESGRGNTPLLAEQLGTTQINARQKLHRFRQKFGRFLRKRVADSLTEPTNEAVEDELKYMASIFVAYSQQSH
jgi:RNA polymerase sigma-70 factor (ECF subfamily)